MTCSDTIWHGKDTVCIQNVLLMLAIHLSSLVKIYIVMTIIMVCTLSVMCCFLVKIYIVMTIIMVCTLSVMCCFLVKIYIVMTIIMVCTLSVMCCFLVKIYIVMTIIMVCTLSVMCCFPAVWSLLHWICYGAIKCKWIVSDCAWVLFWNVLFFQSK